MYAQHMQISVEVHDPLEIKQRIDEPVAELNYQRILSVRIDDRMHFHGPDQKKIPFHQLVSPLIHHEDIGISRANQHELTVRMPVRLIATLLVSG